MKYVNGRVPVVATGSFGLTIEDKAEFSKKIYDTGIDAVILITGHYAKIDDSDEMLLRNFDKMFGLTGDIPMGLYECPAPYKRIITPEVFKELLATDRLVYHKDTSIELEQVKAKLDLIEKTASSSFMMRIRPMPCILCRWAQKECRRFQVIFIRKYWCGCVTMQPTLKNRKR